MSLQLVKAACEQERLSLEWIIQTESPTILIQIANDLEFTKGTRLLLLPRTTRCALTVATGVWFIRLGWFVGGEHEGRVEWTGVAGPVPVVSLRPAPKPAASVFKIEKTTPIQNGVRLTTTFREPYWCLYEMSEREQFLASETKMGYAYDWGRSYFDCLGLSESRGMFIRIRTFPAKVGSLPEHLVREMTLPRMIEGKQTAAQPINLGTATENAAVQRGAAFVREVKEKPNFRFSSHSDYVAYLAAKAISSGKKFSR
jgi:hypothetical protein